MSDPTGEREEHGPSFGERVLDVMVYAPTGLVLTAIEDLPELAAKGRARLDHQIHNARVIGRFVVTMGHRDLKQRLGRAGGAPAPAPAGRTRHAPAPGHRPPPREPGTGHVAPPPVTEPLHPRPAAAGTGPHRPGTRTSTAAAVDEAIPGYDTLSASQVVRRLEGLGPGELASVHDYELATRGRRTILHRAQQLLGTEDLPGSSHTPT